MNRNICRNVHRYVFFVLIFQLFSVINVSIQIHKWIKRKSNTVYIFTLIHSLCAYSHVYVAISIYIHIYTHAYTLHIHIPSGSVTAAPSAGTAPIARSKSSATSNNDLANPETAYALALSTSRLAIRRT